MISIQNNFHILFLNIKVKLEKHASQKDYSTGFGGKYGVQEGSKDKVRYCCTSSLNVMIPNATNIGLVAPIIVHFTHNIQFHICSRLWDGII